MKQHEAPPMQCHCRSYYSPNPIYRNIVEDMDSQTAERNSLQNCASLDRWMTAFIGSICTADTNQVDHHRHAAQ
eukprot:scaffold4374_cov84-Skeletonema_dohrnii-CCMP3373.AAC.2